MLIDSHAHLSFHDYKPEELEGVLARAKENGVETIINIGGGEGYEGNLRAVELAEHYPHIFAAVGIHPHDAKEVTDSTLENIRHLISDHKVVAIGEIGLDFHYKHSEPQVQEEVFRQFIRLGKEKKLPLIIHNRNSDDRLYQILEEEKGFEGGGVIHCFSSTWEFAKKVIDKGFHISFSGIITFKKADDLREVVRKTPTECFLVETDCPYLTPEPHRGKRNEPAFIRYTAQKIAEIKKLTLEDVARTTSLNTRRLFRLGEVQQEPQIAYRIRNSVYLNITNICTIACVFCPKFSTFEVKGYYLRLPKAPTFEEVLQAMGDFGTMDEVVFCGFGEPTQRLDLLKQIATYVHAQGKKVRLDTDGLGNLIHGRNICPELSGLVDAVSISLNAPDAQTYAKVCPSRFKEEAYPQVKNFILEIKKVVPEVTASVVGMPDIDVERCREIVEKELGVKFRLREYNQVG